MMSIAEVSVPPTPAEEHFLRAIDGATIERSPFAHTFVRDAFPQSYYEQMLRQFPARDLLISNGQAGRGNQLQSRFVFELKPEYLGTLPPQQQKFWSGFMHWILSERLKSNILEKFSDQIRNRFADISQIESYSDAVLVEDHTDHAMGPHTDHPRKLVTLLFYLPRDASQQHLGTSIYVPKDRTLKCSGLAHHSFDEFDRVRTFPFVPNALVMFAKTDNSFHGVEVVDDSKPRWLLMLNINRRERPR